MRLEDYQKKVFNEVLGVWNRGEDDQAPEDHFSDCLNIEFGVGQWKTRAGLSSSINLGYTGGKVRKFTGIVGPVGPEPTILILDDSGNLYTYSSRAGDNATVSKISVPNAIDFVAVMMLGKTFIAFSDGNYGLSGVNLKVLTLDPNNPTNDVIRDAAGLAPVASGSMVATDGSTGIVNAGSYKIAVSYITSTGFVTQPGPKIAGAFSATAYTAPGSKKINLSNIPIGPPGTTSRQILITKAGLEEFFFLPSAFGGVLEDNITTSTILDFDDTTDLVDSADSLFDLLESIPAPLTLQKYNSRLVTGGEHDNPSISRVSNIGDPESFDSIDGIVAVEKDDGFSIYNTIVIRDTLYYCKNLGIYSTNDNDDVPSTWQVTPVDLTTNVGVHGIADFFNVSRSRMSRDWTLIADRSGILLFDGIVRKEPITFKIQDYWQSINFAAYYRIMLVVDEHFHKIYCTIPVGSSSENNLLLVGDYNLCPGNIPEKSAIKWSVYQFKPGGSIKRPTSITMIGFPPDIYPRLKIGSIDGGGKIWTLDSGLDNDDGTPIESMWESALLFDEPGWIHFFNAARLRISGSGVVYGSIRGLDNINPDTIPSIILPCLGQERLIRYNFQNEKAKLKFRMTAGYMIISKIEYYMKPFWPMRPDICEGEGEIIIPIEPPEFIPPIIISSCPLSPIPVNVPFSYTFHGSNGTIPYHWEVVEGSLPTGLSLDQSTGIVSGTPTTPGTYNYTIRLTDSS